MSESVFSTILDNCNNAVKTFKIDDYHSGYVAMAVIMICFTPITVILNSVTIYVFWRENKMKTIRYDVVFSNRNKHHWWLSSNAIFWGWKYSTCSEQRRLLLNIFSQEIDGNFFCGNHPCYIYFDSIWSILFHFSPVSLQYSQKSNSFFNSCRHNVMVCMYGNLFGCFLRWLGSSEDYIWVRQIHKQITHAKSHSERKKSQANVGIESKERCFQLLCSLGSSSAMHQK